MERAKDTYLYRMVQKDLPEEKEFKPVKKRRGRGGEGRIWLVE